MDEGFKVHKRHTRCGPPTEYYSESIFLVPERSERPQGTENSQDPQDAAVGVRGQLDDDVNPGDDHQEAVHDVPRTAQVRGLTHVETLGNHLGEGGGEGDRKK